MRTIEALMGSSAVHRIGWALLHSLWLSTGVALVLAVVLRRLRRAPAESRYLAACIALVMMVALPATTSSILSPAPGAEEAVGSSAPAHRRVTIDGAAGEITTNRARSSPHFAWLPSSARPRALLCVLVAAWMAGVTALTLRLLCGWLLLRRLTRQARLLAGPCDEALARLARALRIRRAVRLLESSLVQVPMVIGGLRPMILLPIAALTGLPPRQLEALLAHELAHIRRHDYLVNLAQSVIEVVLFYHPAAWWASRVIRAEREHCCDDLAVRACGDRPGYARALAAMEGLRGAPSLSLAASGGPLLARVRRILNPEVESMHQFSTVVLGAPLLLASVLLVGAPTQPPDGPARGVSGDGVRCPVDVSSRDRDRPIRTVYVPVFRSASLRRGANYMLTEMVQKEIEQRTRYKVVGSPGQADTFLVGTINFAEKDLIVEDLFRLTRPLTARIEVAMRWMDNPPTVAQEKAPPTIVGETFTFDPSTGATAPGAFYGTCKGLAKKVVDLVERRTSGGSRQRPAVAPATALASEKDEPGPTDLAERPTGGPGPGQGVGSGGVGADRGTARDDGRVQAIPEVPPSQEEVWDKVPRYKDGPQPFATLRYNVRIRVEKIGEKLEACKVYPLAGPCQLVHHHYKCTVSYDEQRQFDAPLPVSRVAHHVEVVYIDKEYLRRCPDSARMR